MQFPRVLTALLFAAWMRRTDPPPVSGPASIGAASMAADGTTTLQLRAEDAHGTEGEALFVYPPTHARYASIRRHLPTLQPGGSVPVPPFPP